MLSLMAQWLWGLKLHFHRRNFPQVRDHLDKIRSELSSGDVLFTSKGVVLQKGQELGPKYLNFGVREISKDPELFRDLELWNFRTLDGPDQPSKVPNTPEPELFRNFTNMTKCLIG